MRRALTVALALALLACNADRLISGGGRGARQVA
jgi:hypothetical protein